VSNTKYSYRQGGKGIYLLDIKTFDPDRHHRLTGVSNAVILAKPG